MTIGTTATQSQRRPADWRTGPIGRELHNEDGKPCRVGRQRAEDLEVAVVADDDEHSFVGCACIRSCCNGGAQQEFGAKSPMP